MSSHHIFLPSQRNSEGENKGSGNEEDGAKLFRKTHGHIFNDNN